MEYLANLSVRLFSTDGQTLEYVNVTDRQLVGELNLSVRLNSSQWT